MLLSQLQQYQQGNKITISYIEQPFIFDQISIKIANKINILSLNYCQISTLSGIQQFENLIELHLKYNEISQSSQLNYIHQNSKYSLKVLNLIGNDIQYYSQCRYRNLIQVFPQLQQLNGKNYKDNKLKKNKEKDIKSIIKELNNVKKLMKQTIKKSNKFEQTKYKQQAYQKDYYKQSILPDLEDENKQNLKDISLSNIVLTKSLRSSIDPHTKKRNALQINTSVANDAHHLPLTQPTATFAKQRVIQQKQDLRKFYKNIEQDVYQQQFSEITKRPGGLTGSIFGQITQNIMENRQDIAIATYQQNLIFKVFRGLQYFSQQQRYMPKKSSFF